MIIETLSMGRLEVSQQQLYHFHKGIPGFEEETDFALIGLGETPFWVLQSVKEPELSFLLADPFNFYPGYEFDLPDEEAEELRIRSEVIIRSMITLKGGIEQATINLLAPLVFNPNERIGKQIIIHSGPYHTKHILLQEQPAIDGKDGG